MRTTVDVIGEAIRRGSRYLPIRNRAAALASTAPPKDYPGQVKAIYNDFVKRWRYVKDPLGQELVTTSPQQIFQLVMGGRSQDPGVGLGRGAGDCDDAAVAIGAQLMAIGMPVRIATIAPEGAPAGRLMSHVFVQTMVPGLGWLTVDPVVHPVHGFGYTPPHSRMAVYDLNGDFLEGTGNLRNMSGVPDATNKKEYSMYLSGMQDLAGIDDYSQDEPLDFRQYGIKDFGIYSETMGIMDLGDSNMNLLAEVQTDSSGRVWTPILEMRPKDYDYVRRTGRAYHGMQALGDDLEPYQYDSNLGFFKRIFKKVRKKARKIAKKLLKKIPGGKYLLKLGSKIWKVSKKLLKPLSKFVGKYAAKLAPVAALIPGFGPAVAAGLYTAGKVAKLMNKYGVLSVKKKGEPVAKLKFPKGKAAKAFQKALKKAAKAEKAKGKSLSGKKKRRIVPSRRPVRRVGGRRKMRTMRRVKRVQPPRRPARAR